jgi:multisubunit Na+/H+ antiporter MnhE subunit
VFLVLKDFGILMISSIMSHSRRTSMTPDEVVKLAEFLLKQIEIPSGIRVVLIATDEEGDFVGVTSNVSDATRLNMLACAIAGDPGVTHIDLSDSEESSSDSTELN